MYEYKYMVRSVKHVDNDKTSFMCELPEMFCFVFIKFTIKIFMQNSVKKHCPNVFLLIVNGINFNLVCLPEI